MKIDKSLVLNKLSDMDETIRSLRALGLPRAVYDELSKNDEPDLNPHELCVLGDLIDLEPLDLIGPEDIANLMKSLPIASENSNNDELDAHLIIPTSLDDIKADFHSAATISAAAIDVQSRWPDLSAREIIEWEGIKDTKVCAPKIGWINLLPETVFVDVAEKLKLFQEGLENLTINKQEMSENLSTLAELLTYAEEINKLEQIDELFVDDRYDIFYKRVDRPMFFSECSYDYDVTRGSGYVPLAEYHYVLKPQVTRHCFIVTPKQTSRTKACLIFKAARFTRFQVGFHVDDNENFIDVDTFKEFRQPIVAKEKSNK